MNSTGSSSVSCSRRRASSTRLSRRVGIWFQTKLVDQEDHDRTGNFDISAGKDPEKPGRSQHERKAEAVVIATQSIDDLPVASVQMEIPRQLIRRRSGGEIGIALPLLVGQVAGGHTVRNLGVLRRSGRTQETQDFFLAKFICGSHYFSNMFCNAREALA